MTCLRAVGSTLVAVLAALSLVACGGGGGSEPDAAAPTTTKPADPGDDQIQPAGATDGDDDEEPAASATTDEEQVACVAMAASLLVPLSDDPARTNEVTLSDLLPDLDAIATRGPEEVRADALVVADRTAAVESWDWASGTRPSRDVEAAATDLLEAYDRLIDWAAATCALGEVYWGCAAPVGFLVPSRQVTEATPAAGLTPEDALTGDRARAEEVARSEDQVVFAWVDDRGLALRREVVVAVAGGWAPNGDISCR